MGASPHSDSSSSRIHCPSVIKFHSQFTEIIHDEFMKGQYLSPLSKVDLQLLIGPFQSSPFSIIPKPAEVSKFCVLQNYSFPYKMSVNYPNLSINSFINSDNFPATWGTFTITCLLLCCLPPGSQIATLLWFNLMKLRSMNSDPSTWSK